MSEYRCETLSPEQAKALFAGSAVWFHPVFMQAIACLYAITPKVVVCYKKNNPVACLPLYEKKRLGIAKAYNPVLVYYSPVAFYIPQRKLPNQMLLIQFEILKAIGEYLYSQYRFLKLNLTPQVTDIRALRDCGFQITPNYTFIKDLHAPQDFFINEMTTLRKAEKAGYGFSQGHNPKRLLELLYAMYKRKHHPFDVPIERHLDLLKTLAAEQLIEQYNVLYEDNIVSAMLIIPGAEKTVYAWQTATEEAHLTTGASLLLWSQLYTVLKDRFDYFDLCGANAKGPSRLKAALGAELKLFFQLNR